MYIYIQSNTVHIQAHMHKKAITLNWAGWTTTNNKPCIHVLYFIQHRAVYRHPMGTDLYQTLLEMEIILRYSQSRPSSLAIDLTAVE